MPNDLEWHAMFRNYAKDHFQHDTGHDLDHYDRVWKVCKKLAVKEENVNMLVVSAASYFHDMVHVPKTDPTRSEASKLSAIEAEKILNEMAFPSEFMDAVKHVIESHSFSANIQPETIEAKILQDADRIDALGAIGIARCFAVSGTLGRKISNQLDPSAQHRFLDDHEYTLDHFYTKLFTLHTTMNTKSGKKMALKRTKFMKKFVKKLLKETEIP